jgi:XTP/dITP diphosphohydrolase
LHALLAMTTAPLLVLGTANRKKGIELTDVLAPVGLQLRTLADFPNAISVVEDGATFAENAALKASQQAIHLGQWVLGEDSGLAVDALDGAPGVYSARYSGEHGDDASNNRLLLERLTGVPPEARTAHYVCQMRVADPTGAIRAASEGVCCGRMLTAGRGSNGFGYDPLFEVIEYHHTFGELSGVVKAFLSHRARAARQLIPQLIELVDRGAFASIAR